MWTIYKTQRKNTKIKKKTEIQDILIKTKEVDKTCFQHMIYGDFKDFSRRTAADKVLRDKAFDIAKDPKYDGYQCGLASMVYKVFDKKTSGVR